LSNMSATWTHVTVGVTSLAGIWYTLVSLPLFHFLVLRWVWRLLVWWIILWRFSRLNLQLVSTHPDRAGGLGILAESIWAFIPIMFALSALLASVWCGHVLYDGSDVSEFHRPFIAFFVAALLIPIAPLLVFTGRLIRLKVLGLHDFGVLANRHSLLFDQKWIQEAEKNLPTVLGTPDISSLCDIATDYQTVQGVRFVPFRFQDLLVLAATVFIPMIPLLLIEIPLRDLITKIGGALL
jgi:hypothetical protein